MATEEVASLELEYNARPRVVPAEEGTLRVTTGPLFMTATAVEQFVEFLRSIGHDYPADEIEQDATSVFGNPIAWCQA